MVFGVLALAIMPVAILGTRYSSTYHLLDAGFAIPAAILTGVLALLLARSARHRNERALGRLGGQRAIRWARILATTGICLALTALISVAVYEFLNRVGGNG